MPRNIRTHTPSYARGNRARKAFTRAGDVKMLNLFTDIRRMKKFQRKKNVKRKKNHSHLHFLNYESFEG